MFSRPEVATPSTARLSREPCAPDKPADASAESGCAAWFECDPTPVFMIGPGALLLQANPAGRELLRRRAIELSGGRIALVDIEARRSFAAAVIRALSESGGPQTLVLRTNDGQWRRVFLRRSPAEIACAFLAFGCAFQ
jgi:hypothetical protein